MVDSQVVLAGKNVPDRKPAGARSIAAGRQDGLVANTAKYLIGRGPLAGRATGRPGLPGTDNGFGPARRRPGALRPQ